MVCRIPPHSPRPPFVTLGFVYHTEQAPPRSYLLTILAVFGGFALSSYGGFWMSIAILLIPGGFDIEGSYTQGDFYAAFGLYIFGWMIVTFGIW